MKVKVYVTLKKGVLEPQGQTVLHALEALGYDGIKDIRVGKYIEMEFSENSNSNNDDTIREMCEKVLSNPVIETYRIEKA